MEIYRGHSISEEFAGIGNPPKHRVRSLSANGVTAKSMGCLYGTAEEARQEIDRLEASEIWQEAERQLLPPGVPGNGVSQVVSAFSRRRR